MTPLDREECYQVVRARDRRQDGVFYVGLTTTAIYCRPSCFARPPRLDRCRFYATAAAAERNGFRSCLRCRPERAPGMPLVIESFDLAWAALQSIEAGELNGAAPAQLAAALKVEVEELEAAFETAWGVNLLEAAVTRRLGLATRLVRDTSLPLVRIAEAAGFGSLQAMDILHQRRFGRGSAELRRKLATEQDSNRVLLQLEARPPYPGEQLFGFLASRAIPGVELVSSQRYSRVVRLAGASGRLDVELAADRAGIRVQLDAVLLSQLPELLVRLRALFDLDARPELIDAHLAQDPLFESSVARLPGLRVPGAFDLWELVLRAILGQQVSVRAATTLAGRLVQTFGEQVPALEPGLDWIFPSAERLAALEPAVVARVGLTGARAASIVLLARAVVEGRVQLSSGCPDLLADLQRVPGIGVWTAQYIALRGLHRADAFLETDLMVKKVLALPRAADVLARAAAWRPWRSYALMRLWMGLQPSPEGAP